MDTHHALRHRRTAHDYVAEPIDPAALERALEAAHQAPNHRHTWPWRFTLVGPETRAQLAEVAVEVKGRKRPLTPEGEAKVRAKVLNPGALIVLRQALCDDPATCEEDYASLACAAQNAMLSLFADGYHSKWSTGGVTTAPGTYALLGVDSARERIVGFLWAGKAAKVPEVRRPELPDLVQRLP